MHKNKLIIPALSLFLLFSCSSDITGVVLLDDIYSIRVKKIMQEYTENKYEAFQKYFNDDVKTYYSYDIYYTKSELLEAFKSDFYYYSNIGFSSKEVYTIFNSDRTYTTIFKSIWNAKGNFTNNKYKVFSFYKFIWRNNKIISVNTYCDNSSFFEEFAESNK
ncbi:MAG: hypothetical protein ABF268_07960 [Polaribacter sp.]